MLNFKNISLQRAQHVLFEDVNITLQDRHKVGLVGANGTGKTSLFAMLQGELEPSGGEISIPQQLRIAHVVQEIKGLKEKARDYVLKGDRDYDVLQQALSKAEKNEDYDKVVALHEKISEIDGYSAPLRAAQLLSGLGFDEQAQQQSVESFSGGWRMRLNLARALMARSDVLLLDEPTNHLDLEAVLWLEKKLQQYDGLLIIISHDREFLDKIIDHVMHIEHRGIKFYTGNYSRFEELRAQQMALQQSHYEKQQRQIKHMMKFVERFRYKSSKAKQAQSRLKAIENIERVAAVQADSPFHFEFKAPDRSPYPLLKLNNVNLGYGDEVILQKINWQLIPGDRIALLGPNGAGKSTLIKAIAGMLKPIQGDIEIDKAVKVGYFAQHQLEALNVESNALSHMRELAPKKTPLELRKYLGGFGFSGDQALKPIANFSGGEKSRLALALIVWKRPNLLLLDEPTNHLDMEMHMALTMALQSFEGALILISHDRYLIRNTVDSLCLVNNKQVKKFDGDLDDYKRWVFDQQKKPSQKTITNQPKTKVGENPKKKKRANPIKLAALEKEIAKREAELAEITKQLSDPKLYQSEKKEKQKQLYTEQECVQTALKKAEDAWLKHG